MQNNEQNPFMERRTLVAILIAGVFFVAWQQFLNWKYPNHNKPAVTAPAATAPTTMTETPSTANSAATGTQAPTGIDAKSAPVLTPARVIQYEGQKVSFELTSRGMGVRNFTVKSYKNHDGEPIRLGISDASSLFELRWSATQIPLEFQIREISPGQYEGTADVGTASIVRTMTYHPETSSFDSRIVVKNGGTELSKGLSILIPEQIHVAKSTSIFFPSYDHQDFFISHSGQTESLNINHAKEDQKKEFKTSSIVSIGSQYFASAILDRSEISPEVTVSSSVNGKTAIAEMAYKPVQVPAELALQQVFYAGPKSIDLLAKIDPEMTKIVDFGFFTLIARPMLYTMKWFFGLVGNWGFAIILLTLLVRFIVLPFNIMSFRSMKAMQRIQPQLTQLRERYKEDPMTLNREMMALMKENNANPIGGCLPMLLQIPIFFALWRVISSSAELYQSPFVGWIHDLSVHDSFYVLPILMGITMFVQQKLTPSAMDPTQAKVMAFMPLVFTAFMLNLPSGVALYMVVSALFGITQQWLILKNSSAPVPVQSLGGKK